MALVPMIDPNDCLAHGNCEDTVPSVFKVDDISTVIGTGPDDLIRQAAENCPAGAIRLVDSETDEQVYP